MVMTMKHKQLSVKRAVIEGRLCYNDTCKAYALQFAPVAQLDRAEDF